MTKNNEIISKILKLANVEKEEYLEHISRSIGDGDFDSFSESGSPNIELLRLGIVKSSNGKDCLSFVTKDVVYFFDERNRKISQKLKNITLEFELQLPPPDEEFIEFEFEILNKKYKAKIYKKNSSNISKKEKEGGYAFKMSRYDGYRHMVTYKIVLEFDAKGGEDRPSQTTFWLGVGYKAMGNEEYDKFSSKTYLKPYEFSRSNKTIDIEGSKVNAVRIFDQYLAKKNKLPLLDISLINGELPEYIYITSNESDKKILLWTGDKPIEKVKHGIYYDEEKLEQRFTPNRKRNWVGEIFLSDSDILDLYIEGKVENGLKGNAHKLIDYSLISHENDISHYLVTNDYVSQVLKMSRRILEIAQIGNNGMSSLENYKALGYTYAIEQNHNSINYKYYRGIYFSAPLTFLTKFKTNKFRLMQIDLESGQDYSALIYELKKIAIYLRDNDKVELKIIGHTDSTGDNNDELSQKRAQSIRDFLVENEEIESTRISYEGVGARDCLQGGDQPDCRKVTFEYSLKDD